MALLLCLGCAQIVPVKVKKLQQIPIEIKNEDQNLLKFKDLFLLQILKI